MALCVPAFLGFLGLTAPRTYRGKGLAFLAFFFLLGFAVYLYLPIRSLTGPAFDWGYPQTWQRFLDHITDRGHAPLHTVFYWQQLPYQLQRYLGHVLNEFALLGAGLGLLGCGVLLRSDPALWGMLFLVFLGNVLFFVRIWTDTAWGFIPSFVIFALWVGYGMHACLTLLARLTPQRSRRLWRVTVYAGLWGGVVVTLGHLTVRHAAVTNQAQNYATALYGAQLIEQLPPDALLLCEYEWFPLLYLQQVERQRPDLTFLRQGGVFVTRARFPNIRLGASDTLALQSPAAFLQLAQFNAPEHPLFLSLDGDWQHYFAAHLRPQGLLLTLHPGVKVDVTPADLQRHEDLLSRMIQRLLQGGREDATTFFLAHKLNLTALYFSQIGRLPEAAKTYQTALQLRPDYDKVLMNYGALLISQGNFAEARVQLDLAYRLNPAHPTVHKTLGVLMLRMANMARAIDFFERAIAFGEPGGDVYAQLGELYARLGQFADARRALHSALVRYREPTAQNAADSRLQEKMAAVMQTLQRV